MRELTIGKARLELHQGDITDQVADAIVNAANEHLAGGGGVDGAIHRAGGPAIMKECREIGHCPTGGAVITSAGNLHARHVIHAVAPRYRGKPQDAELLRSAYADSLERAEEVEARVVAFPSLGTGAYGYPIEEAAPIALGTCLAHLKGPTDITCIRFVLFSAGDLSAYEEALERLAAEQSAL